MEPAGPSVPAAQYDELVHELHLALARAERAEAELEVQKTSQAKLQAKLAAVTTLYTEAMQRDAALKASLSWRSENSLPG